MIPASPKAVGIITAAGSSRRMGGNKKEYIEWNGMSFLEHAIQSFIRTEIFLSLLIIHPIGKPPDLEHIRSKYPEMTIILCTGGDSRQKSVFNGLNYLKSMQPDLVLIHDGARPWITPSLIKKVYNEVLLHRAAVPLIPATYAIKEWGSDGFINAHLDRTSLTSAQTPQGFIYSEILTAHEKAQHSEKSYVDDTEIYHDFIGRVKGIKGDPANIKITYKQDLPS